MVNALAGARRIESCDLSSLKYVLCGAAPIDPQLTERAQERIGCLIRQGYGLTGASPGSHQVFDPDFADTPLTSIGTLSAGTRARLVTPGTDIDVPPGTRGELLIRGPQMMSGYLHDQDATETTLCDGWLRTGDLARADQNGRLWIEGRLEEINKYKGYQIAPAELEAVLRSHPAIEDAAVIGVSHPTGGEVPRACVVPGRRVRPAASAGLGRTTGSPLQEDPEHGSRRRATAISNRKDSSAHLESATLTRTRRYRILAPSGLARPDALGESIHLARRSTKLNRKAGTEVDSQKSEGSHRHGWQ
jgi:acyl-CoA synthetase (AMP-forming)/AMP-acid ligase II